MAADRVYKFWICVECGILVCVTLFIIIQVFTGSEVSKTPRFMSISSATLIFWCLALIVTTIAYACRRHLPEDDPYMAIRFDFVKKYYRHIDYRKGSDCVICLEQKGGKSTSVVELTCKHSYHKRCISQFLNRLVTRTKLTCPVCRQLLEKFPNKKMIAHRVATANECV